MIHPILRPTWFFLILFVSVGPATAQVTRFVDVQATGPTHDGSSWCQAFLDLQLALAVSSNGDSIRVADGTYLPDGGTGDQNATFAIPSGVALFGGYAGCGATNPDERDFQNTPTVLSGDLDGDDAPGFTFVLENSVRVVTIGTVVASTRLDGATIRGGNADNFLDGGGASVAGPATIANCRFEANTAFRGGALAITGNPVIRDCQFVGNRANKGGAAYVTGHPTMLRSSFVGNIAEYGGGMEILSSMTVLNSVFLSNSATYGGGVAAGYTVDIFDGGSTLVNCLFVANDATLHGGGIWSYGAPGPYFTNCTIISNTAGGQGGGAWAYNSGFLTCEGVNLRNSIVRSNTAVFGGGQIALQPVGDPDSCPSSVFVERSNIEGGQAAIFDPGDGTIWWDVGNIDVPVMFADADGGDNVLGTPDDDFRPAGVAPGIDAGRNYSWPADEFDLDGDANVTEPCPIDLGGAPRYINDPRAADTGVGPGPIIDMGAYESQGPPIPAASTAGMIVLFVSVCCASAILIVRKAAAERRALQARNAR